MAIVLWVSGELFGAILGNVVLGADGSFWLNYVLALLGAIIGAGIAFLIMHLLPSQGIIKVNSQQEIPCIQKISRSGCIPVSIIVLSIFCVFSPMIAGFLIKLGDKSIVDLPADVENTKIISRDGFELQYPGNWVLDSKDKDYDPDHKFTIESPGPGGDSIFVVMDMPTDPLENVELLKDDFLHLILNAEITDFTIWGNYSGYGVTLSGRYLMQDATVRIFSYSSSSRSFAVIELGLKDSETLVRSGLQLIEKSFQLKE